ncbi:Lethal(2) giant larvae protein homolog 2 [Strongyloides ratti]|uniref:Lethal(2) giant larvae protein homolog 2 n=1 Tax=Strongyloides ratti TaxID=34506 RepID=A0A090LP47_STRRB|nr:Lethal(2) giant larvae protein homolog 2 [Strongyloides ratti]CEF71620.1 Lethal(2) giant larvae protein homolog 2 [Strongyloides ratti]
MANIFTRKKIFGKNTPPDFLAKNFQITDNEFLGFNDNISIFHPGKYGNEIVYATSSNNLGFICYDESPPIIKFAYTIYKIFYIDNIDKKTIVVITGSGKKDFKNIYILNRDILFSIKKSLENKNCMENIIFNGNDSYVLYKKEEIFMISCLKIYYDINSFSFYYANGNGHLNRIIGKECLLKCDNIKREKEISFFFETINISNFHYFCKNIELQNMANFTIQNFFVNVMKIDSKKDEIFIVIGDNILFSTIFGSKKLNIEYWECKCSIVKVDYDRYNDAIVVVTSDTSTYLIDGKNINEFNHITNKSKLLNLEKNYLEISHKNIKDFFFINTLTNINNDNKLCCPYIIFDDTKNLKKIQEYSKCLTIFNTKNIGKKYIIESEIYDYHVTSKKEFDNDNLNYNNNDDILFILCRNEFILIDLNDDPYYREIHPGLLLTLDHHTVTKTVFIDNVSNEIFSRLICLQKNTFTGIKYTRMFEFPTSKIEKESLTKHNNLLLIGYGNGEVYFFKLMKNNFKYIFKLDTKNIFEDGINKKLDIDDELENLFLPNLNYGGVFDDYLDSENLAITSLYFVKETGEIFIGNHGGYVLKFNLPSGEERSIDSCNLSQIIVSKSNLQLPKGAISNVNDELIINKEYLQPSDNYQLNGNCTIKGDGSKITKLVYEKDEKILVIGTEFSLHIYSYKKNKIIFETVTFTQSELSYLSNAPLSRFKSLKKSLRQTFRRKQKIDFDGNKIFENDNFHSVERQIESRAISKTMDCLLSKDPCVVDIVIAKESFHRDYILNIYVGLYKGEIHCFTLTDIINGCYRNVFPKDTIFYKHSAPIVKMKLFTLPGDICPNKLIIANEERIFTRPLLCSKVRKDNYKWKITTFTGCRVKDFNIYNICTNDILISASLSDGTICSIVLSDKKKYALRRFVDERNKNAISTAMLLSTGELIHYNKRGCLILKKQFLNYNEILF